MPHLKLRVNETAHAQTSRNRRRLNLGELILVGVLQATRQAHNWYFENYNRTNLKPYIGPGKEAFSRRSNSHKPVISWIATSLTPLLIITTLFRIRII